MLPPQHCRGLSLMWGAALQERSQKAGTQHVPARQQFLQQMKSAPRGIPAQCHFTRKGDKRGAQSLSTFFQGFLTWPSSSFPSKFKAKPHSLFFFFFSNFTGIRWFCWLFVINKTFRLCPGCFVRVTLSQLPLVQRSLAQQYITSLNSYIKRMEASRGPNLACEIPDFISSLCTLVTVC